MPQCKQSTANKSQALKTYLSKIAEARQQNALKAAKVKALIMQKKGPC